MQRTVPGDSFTLSAIAELARPDAGRVAEPAHVATTEQSIVAAAIGACEEAFRVSVFFGALTAGELDPAALAYVFAQYRCFRSQLHRWFGLCILKTATCEDPAQRAAI